MYCKKCGKELRDSAKYCPKCGNAVSANRQKLEKNLNKQTDISKQTDRSAKKRKGCGWIIAILVIAIVAVIAVGGIFCYQNDLLPFYVKTNANTENVEENGTLVKVEESEEIKEREEENTSQQELEDEEKAASQTEIVRTEGYVALVNAYASSQLMEKKRGVYSATHVYDNNLNTPWCEDADGVGIGEWITVELEGEYEVTALEFYNGFMESYELLDNNSQICNTTLEFSDGTQQSLTLKKNLSLDNPVTVRLNTPVVTSSIKITIDSAYSGEKFEDTCLAELRVVAYDGTAQLPELVHLS